MSAFRSLNLQYEQLKSTRSHVISTFFFVINIATEEITIEDDTETGTSSDESAVEDDRVAFQISDSLKQFLEYDFIMITKQNKLVNLPAKIPVTTILENYVKYHSIKTICGPVEVAAGPRRRNSAAKNEKREKDFEKIRNR